ncbi:hypothetical protein PPYR_12099 [Photinus pyralis]|uniref:Uncharacterized protein n=1 Tax=Photinus pyralis TaxID=7054 RepID=A0A1Y1LBG1_PHOPY|nr:uncharacterized protein LOC116175952 [Photinus pyralis]KAB0795260.1 hypothetical protein PPYR_12099 [Photinus pyralis]
MSTVTDRKIKDVRDIWGSKEDKENPRPSVDNLCQDHSSKHKYKTLERHLSMKKTIRRKMMRDLREIGDSSNDNDNNQSDQGFLEQIKADQPPPANIDKPSFWKRLTKGWGHS